MVGWLLLFFVFFEPVSFTQETDTPASADEQAAPTENQNETQPQQPETPQAAVPQEEQAPAKPLPVIMAVEVRGNQIVSTNTILSKVRSQKGQTIAQEMINEDVKRLYATGFFQDIRMELEESPQGYTLVVSVEEKPIVRHVTIEGFTVFKEDKIRKEFKVIEGQILDRKVVKEGVEGIRKLYADKGFKFIDVQSDITVNPQTREADIKIRIIEGEKFKIKDIQFEGTQAFKPKKLRKLIKTKKDMWYTSGVFKEANFQKDIERLQLFYQQEGYLDVKVSPRFDYDKSGKKIFIIIQIDEGRHYVTGEVKIKGNQLFPESEIWQALEMLPGLTYSQYYLFKDVEKIRDYYYDRGYMEARIVPDIRLNKDTGKVDVTYQIEEGDLFFIEKVVVRGNTKTKDMVIRRELRIRPGEKFDGGKIQKSKQRLENLDYFEDITYDTEPVPTAPNRKNIIFRVKEKRTGELSFGGGISSVDRFVGFSEISQRNFDLWNFPRFTGGGQSFSLKARVGSISQDFSLSFVEPYLLNRPISLGTDVFSTHRGDRNVDFEETRRGFSATLSKVFRDVFRVGTGYTLEDVKIDELSSDAPQTIKDVEGGNLLSRVRLFTSYDTRNNIINPTRGTLISLDGDLVGGFLGGKHDYYIVQTGVTQYWNFFKKHILEAKVRLGASQEFGNTDQVPVFDRFFAGGLGSVRGFNYRRVGPIEAGDAVGGQTLALASLEYTFPVPFLEAFRGAFFIDAGQVNADSYKITFSDFAVSVGPGIKIKTPIGPVAFYYGLPIANRDDKDQNGRFEFSLGRGF